MYCNFRTRDLWADCLFARILQKKLANKLIICKHITSTRDKQTLHILYITSNFSTSTQIRILVSTDVLPPGGQSDPKGSCIQQATMPCHGMLQHPCQKTRQQI